MLRNDECRRGPVEWMRAMRGAVDAVLREKEGEVGWPGDVEARAWTDESTCGGGRSIFLGRELGGEGDRKGDIGRWRDDEEVLMKER